jgi:hypothetical protein
MKTPRNKHRTNGGPRLLTVVHRYVGLSSAALVLILSATGLMLNHSDDLDMDTVYIQNGSLLSWYGISAPQRMTSIALGDEFITSVDARIFRNTTALQVIDSPLLGALDYQDMHVLATANALFVFANDWQLIERLDSAAGSPLDLLAIGTTNRGQLALQTANGYLLADENLLEWQIVESATATWSQEVETPASIETALLIAHRGKGLSLERVVLDLHSGRLFGIAGVLLVDAAAVLFLILACSGIWLWARRRQR